VFAECEVVGGDVAVFRGGGKALFARGELVHEFEGDVGFLGAEVRGAEAAGELLRGFPADLTAEAGLVTAGVTGAKTAHESEKDCFNEVPIFGATGEESGEGEVLAFEAIDVNDGKIAATGGSDIKAEAHG